MCSVFKNISDLARMFTLILRVPAGMKELRERFENHVHSQGLCAVEKCGDSLFNVSYIYYFIVWVLNLNSNVCSIIMLYMSTLCMPLFKL